MAHRPIPSSPSCAKELDEDLVPERGLKGAPTEPSLSTYVTALEEMDTEKTKPKPDRSNRRHNM
jgi:hypothetical protein